MMMMRSTRFWHTDSGGFLGLLLVMVVLLAITTFLPPPPTTEAFVMRRTTSPAPLSSTRRGGGMHQPQPHHDLTAVAAAAGFSPRFTSTSSTSSSSSFSALKMSSSTTSSNQELLPGIDAINSANSALFEKLDAMRARSYFRLYSVDILASCEYMPQEMFECYTESCEIYPVDDDEIPEIIKQVDMDEHGFELDGWARWDQPSEDYYDTQAFPETYTGYDGSDVWNFIHNRICFDGYGYDDNHWKADFNKAVSGLHAMVSCQITIGIQERIESGEGFADDEIWRDPVAEFERRLSSKGETPLAIENLYFCYMLLLTAVSKARGRLLQDCDSGKIDECAAEALKAALESPLLQDDTGAIGVASTKLHDHAVVNGGTELWEARMRTRELLRIMNCVQCNKCRLHGKISTMGLSTALQILMGRTGEGGDPDRVHRVELAALMSTLHKCSRAVKFCEEMQQRM